MGNCMHIGHVCPAHDHKNKMPPFTPPSALSIKVLHWSDGRISEFCEEQPLKAAELMLVFPNHFMVELEKGNHRPAPLSADTDLKPCHAYLLLPMRRMSTRISQEEMGCFISALSHDSHQDASPTSSAKKSKDPKSAFYRQSRVTPLVRDVDEDGDDHGSDPTDERSETSYVNIQKSYSCPVLSSEKLDAMISAASGSHGPGNIMRMRSRSWAPKLETISENFLVTVSFLEGNHSIAEESSLARVSIMSHPFGAHAHIHQ